MDTLLPYLSTVMAGVFAILLFFYCLLRTSSASKGKIPPEAAGGWPLIGHLHLLGGSQLPHKTLGDMADKYGPVFTIRLGMHRTLVVSTWEMAKECFTTNDVAVASRPKLLASKYLGYNYASFGFAPHGAYWREMRKIANLELLSNQRLELLKHVRASETESSVKGLYKLWIEKKNGSGCVLVDMKQWFGDLTLNVILRMVGGKRYSGATIAVSDEKEARRCQKAMRDFFHLLGLFVVADAIPFLGWLDLGGHEKVMKKTAEEIDSIANEWLEEHRRNRASGETHDGEQDFMDVMLSILEGTNLAGYDADTIIKATVMSLIAGGNDTTTVTLTWALSLLMNNRHVLKKAQDELDLHVGKERLVLNESDISKLVYLQAIFKETLRLYPAGPLSGLRQFSQDCTIGGYHIPEGTRLLVNLKKIQQDPRVWANPSEFWPERFLTTHEDIDVKGQHYELIPFGTGRRACPGIIFGLQVIQLALASLLHAFDISTPSNAAVDMSEIFGLTNAKATPLEVLVTPRLPSSLYE